MKFFAKKDDVTKKIERAIFKKKCQLVAMYTIGVIAGVTGYYSFIGYKEIVSESHVIFIENVQAKSIEVKKETTKDIIERVAREEHFADVEILEAIATCESGDGKGKLDTYAKNKVSSARGLYQILDMHGLSEDERYNAEISTRWAIKEIRKNGTSAWNSSKHCWNNQ